MNVVGTAANAVPVSANLSSYLKRKVAKVLRRKGFFESSF